MVGWRRAILWRANRWGNATYLPPSDGEGDRLAPRGKFVAINGARRYESVRRGTTEENENPCSYYGLRMGTNRRKISGKTANPLSPVRIRAVPLEVRCLTAVSYGSSRPCDSVSEWPFVARCLGSLKEGAELGPLKSLSVLDGRYPHPLRLRLWTSRRHSTRRIRI